VDFTAIFDLVSARAPEQVAGVALVLAGSFLIIEQLIRWPARPFSTTIYWLARPSKV